MNKLAAVGLGLALLAACQSPAAGPRAGALPNSPTQTPDVRVIAPATAAPPVIGQPVQLAIPALGVDARIQNVGLDANNGMAAPSRWDEAGWFELGARPGQPGNAVLAGHLTTGFGTAGIFFRLRDLRAGYYVFVTDDLGQKLSFQVTHSEVYAANAVPLDEVFGAAAKPRLNLITCDGDWTWTNRGFGERLVVYAEAVP